MFSQLTRYASELDVPIEDAEMDIRMIYDTRGKLGIMDISPACQEARYVFKIKSPSPSEKVRRLVAMIDKGCHTVNSLRNPISVVGTLVHNNQEFEIRT